MLRGISTWNAESEGGEVEVCKSWMHNDYTQVLLPHLAGINVSHDSDVPVCVQRHLTGDCRQ